MLQTAPLADTNHSHWRRGVTAAIGIAFLLTRLHATSLRKLDNNHAGALSTLF